MGLLRIATLVVKKVESKILMFLLGELEIPFLIAERTPNHGPNKWYLTEKFHDKPQEASGVS